MKKLTGIIPAVAMVFAVACGQTDSGITSAVKSKLAADDTVKAYQVDVDTNNHVVTLTGDVETTIARERAVQIARDTDGVRDVIDQLRVNDTAATSGRLDTDADNDLEAAGDSAADAAKKAGQATADAAKKVGEETKDVFTDDDRDSDNDGH